MSRYIRKGLGQFLIGVLPKTFDFVLQKTLYRVMLQGDLTASVFVDVLGGLAKDFLAAKCTTSNEGIKNRIKVKKSSRAASDVTEVGL